MPDSSRIRLCHICYIDRVVSVDCISNVIKPYESLQVPNWMLVLKNKPLAKSRLVQ